MLLPENVNRERPACDVTPFVALQRWSELAGDCSVTIPFALKLGEAVPADLVRMRRHYPQLLAAIQASALLYQRQRERDQDGWIIATLDDYTMARNLLLDVFTATATGGVTKTIRETVNALTGLYDGEHPHHNEGRRRRAGTAKEYSSVSRSPRTGAGLPGELGDGTWEARQARSQ